MDTKAKSTYWSITQFKVDAWQEQCQLALQKGWKIEGQLEEATSTKRLHYQAMLYTPNQPRASTVKQVFVGAHIQLAKNPKALKNYVHKEETRVAPMDITQNDHYPSLSKFWDLITQKMFKNEFLIHNKYADPKKGWLYDFTYNTNVDREEWYTYKHFDICVNQLIAEGYHVETMAINPQTRAAWNKYWQSLVQRSLKSQENTNAIQEDDDTQSIQTAEIPTITESESSDEWRESDLYA